MAVTDHSIFFFLIISVFFFLSFFLFTSSFQIPVVDNILCMLEISPNLTMFKKKTPSPNRKRKLDRRARQREVLNAHHGD
ncbi:hypothetical protein BDV26DRAFT_263980 [Aspergillus bertholletiae]|uniref:Uncharacterized protein n=1 Tax=Aspergillus bertholletiae TaxID=1226010 RepID=A0A5N7B584_9EURO|nr:hypothetical protein BDV26DRAFT_263980 [Aspergillus bertholletiae]